MFVHGRRDFLLSAYNDGELSASEGLHVDQHLKTCVSCQAEYSRLSRLTNATRHLVRPGAPPALARSIRRRIDEEIYGMVPVLREQVRNTRSRPVLLPALSLGALLTLAFLSMVVLLDLHAQPGTKRYEAAWGLDSLPTPVLLHSQMTSPRLRDRSVNLLPFTEVERGGEGTMLTLASIDQTGEIRGLEVIHRSGDERMLARTLEVLRASGFEPAQLGDQKVAVNFLHLFTTTEVRLSGRPDKYSLSSRHIMV